MRVQRVGASSVGLADVAPPSGGRVLNDRQPIAVRVGTKQRNLVEVVCAGCQRSRLVRADSFTGAPPACLACTNRRRRALQEPRPRRGQTIACDECGAAFFRHPSDTRRYCSHRCASDAKRQYRIEAHACAHCGRAFPYTEKPFSNSSGTFCTRACRDRAFLGVVHGDRSRPGRSERHGWRSRRNRFFRAGNDFCALCGDTEPGLHVHHIEGFRNVAHDDLSTVVTVCPRHHRALEAWTRRLSGLPPARRRLAAVVFRALVGEVRCIHQGHRVQMGAYR